MNAKPPDMAAAKFRPILCNMITFPPVIYSQPWSPTPSITASAPELRTANRSPATPQNNANPGNRKYDRKSEIKLYEKKKKSYEIFSLIE